MSNLPDSDGCVRIDRYAHEFLVHAAKRLLEVEMLRRDGDPPRCFVCLGATPDHASDCPVTLAQAGLAHNTSTPT